VNETEQNAPPIITPEVVTPEVAENITAPSQWRTHKTEVVVNETEAEAAAPIAENKLRSLTPGPDLASPQRPGAVIIWTASGLMQIRTIALPVPLERTCNRRSLARRLNGVAPIPGLEHIICRCGSNQIKVK